MVGTKKLDQGGERMCGITAWLTQWVQEGKGYWGPAKNTPIPWTPNTSRCLVTQAGPNFFYSFLNNNPKALGLNLPGLVVSKGKGGFKENLKWLGLNFTKFTQNRQLLHFLI